MHLVPLEPAVRSSLPTRTIPLASGTLRLALHREDLPIEQLCDYACRRNPKRSFLFVSKVLGRHHAIEPSVPRSIARKLADRLPADLPGPVLVIGLAEMAVALGQLVHMEYARRAHRPDVLSLQSTRHRVLDTPLRFQEKHSHAAQHYLHSPEKPAAKALFDQSRTLIVVDDEITTGNTAVELARIWRASCPHAERLVVVTPICFASSETMSKALGLPVSVHALVEGTLDFEPNPTWIPGVLPKVQTTNVDHTATLRRDSARLGRLDPAAITPEIAAVAISLAPRSGERILVLGTGEFTYEPLLLGEALSALGATVLLQATSRSPIHLGHAIRSVLELPDAYGEGIQNFLYNASLGEYDRVILFQEAATVPTELADHLRQNGARLEIRTWNR